MISLSPRVCEAVFEVLRQVTQHQLPLDKAYAQHFYSHDHSSEEHAEITKITGSVIRKLNLYAHLCHCTLINIINRFDGLIYSWCIVHHHPFPSHLKLTNAEISAIGLQWKIAKDIPSLLDGCPEWLDQLGADQLGECWPLERKALAKAPQRIIRANALKISPQELLAVLSQEGIESKLVADVEGAILILSNSSLFKSQAFKNGYFEQQDAGSQLIVHALDVKPGMRVIDACAGAGGKTLGLSSIMKGKGKLLAMDVEEHKLDTLKKRAKRASADNIETRLITSSKIIKRQKESADRLLLDVPCSGTGVLKRNPDAKWSDGISNELPSLLILQQEILTRYSQMLKTNGIMIYSTCSILPIENGEQVAKFLTKHPQFELIEEASISPAKTGFDGFYWAKMKRISP